VNKTKDTPSLSEAMEAFVYFSSKGSQDEHEKEHNKTVSVENAQKRGVHISPDGFSGLGSFVGKTTTHEYRATLNNRQSSRKYSWMASITLHILTVLAIAYFILSIELTISWNRITGVYNIKSTGQLIPFIIGVVSSTRAAQQVILGILRKVRVESTLGK
jgi:predicted helicase